LVATEPIRLTNRPRRRSATEGKDGPRKENDKLR